MSGKIGLCFFHYLFAWYIILWPNFGKSIQITHYIFKIFLPSIATVFISIKYSNTIHGIQYLNYQNDVINTCKIRTYNEISLNAWINTLYFMCVIWNHFPKFGHNYVAGRWPQMLASLRISLQDILVFFSYKYQWYWSGS